MPKKRRGHKQRRQHQRPKRPVVFPGAEKEVPISQLIAARDEQDELDEDDSEEMVWEMHPDLNRMRLDGTLPEEMVDGAGNITSPRMHINMHAIIERQLFNNDPEGITDLAVGYEQENKLTSHEIRHALAAAVSEQIWLMSKERRLFDTQQYFLAIERSYETFVRAKN